MPHWRFEDDEEVVEGAGSTSSPTTNQGQRSWFELSSDSSVREDSRLRLSGICVASRKDLTASGENEVWEGA